VLTIGCPLLGVTSYLLYTSATSDPWLTMVLYTLAGFTVGIVAVVPYVMIALFPPGDQVFRDLLFVQYRLCHLWWTDPGGCSDFDRMAPAHYPARRNGRTPALRLAALEGRTRRFFERARFRPVLMGASAYLVAAGPVTAQERWEENAGYSPSTLATIIAALCAGAELARAYGHVERSDFTLAYADWLNSHV
jgi:hypothetical protein